MTAEDTLKESCDKYLKKYIIIEDFYGFMGLFVKHIFIDKMGHIMVLCNIIEIVADKSLHAEESVFHINYFKTLLSEGKMMGEDEFTNVFRKRTFEMTDYLLKYIRRL